jgi:hypothetical protein
MLNMRLLFKPLLILSLITPFFIGCSGGIGLSGGSGTIQGKVLIKGHLPHAYVALKVNSRLYYNLVGKYSRVLRSSYQGKRVIVKGKIVADAVGPGMPARFEVTKIVKILHR